MRIEQGWEKIQLARKQHRAIYTQATTGCYNEDAQKYVLQFRSEDTC